MFRTSLSAFLVGVTCWLLLVPHSAAQNPPLRAAVADSLVQPGDTMTVQVHIGADTAHVPALLGVGFQLDYNPDVLRFLGREVGDLFVTHHPDNTLESGPTVGTASVDYSITLFDVSQLADTLGEVTRLRFEVRSNAASGPHSVTLQNANRSTSSDAYIPIEPEDLFGDAFAVNAPPTATVPLPNDTLNIPGPPLQLTSLGRTLFRDPEGDSLSLSAASNDSGVVEVLDRPQAVVLQAKATGSAEITVTAGDGYGTGTASFTATVTDRPSEVPEPSEHARAVLDSTGADSTAVGFGTTGLEAVFRPVTTGGPVDVRFFTGTGEAAAQPSAAVDSFEHVSRYQWRVEPQGVTFDSVDVRFSLSDTSVVGVGAPTAVTILRDAEGDGTFETALPTTYVDGGTPTDSTDDALVAEGLTALGAFAFASNDADNPLPVELVAFEGTATEAGVRLTWQTASETNNAGFRIERKGEGADGREGAWTQIGFVEGAGTTSGTQSYRFTDADLPYEADRLTYRLQQVDTDGTVHLSKTVTVDRGVQQVRLKKPFPNPTAGQVTVRYALPEAQEVSLRLYDVLGREVRTVVRSEQDGRHEQQLDVSGLSSGTYFLRLRAEGKTATRRRTQKLTIVR